MLLVVVMPRRITRPYDEINGIFEVFFDPVEGSVEEAEGAVTIGDFGPIGPGRTLAPVASILFSYGRMILVERVWMEV